MMAMTPLIRVPNPLLTPWQQKAAMEAADPNGEPIKDCYWAWYSARERAGLADRVRQGCDQQRTNRDCCEGKGEVVGKASGHDQPLIVFMTSWFSNARAGGPSKIISPRSMA